MYVLIKEKYFWSIDFFFTNYSVFFVAEKTYQQHITSCMNRYKFSNRYSFHLVNMLFENYVKLHRFVTLPYLISFFGSKNQNLYVCSICRKSVDVGERTTRASVKVRVTVAKSGEFLGKRFANKTFY